MKISALILAATLILASPSISKAEGNAVVSTENAVSTNTSFTVGMYPSLKNELVVMMKKADNSTVKFRIEDTTGQAVISANISDLGSSIKHYSLDKLEKGTYKVVLSRRDEVFSRQLVIQ
ncbi:Por secretion system C-terminal sorting domain-containing protein [Flexibacter flexilis DSM 6793]|uniref:Por secretion system C-terminal sorting domain-containing protein n=1 Tax=Flexibacter flexilis DSM 6793 TaxID=927664 RepID=A0A1I1KRU3_9BACT|nr:T9SS type A sorting domain-containing protein [Flexibacter flexilis]SFC60883.1 Por secretion system C-terminal sorting domain-containing protein [Flexibacter flexilis DSM 6793]